MLIEGEGGGVELESQNVWVWRSKCVRLGAGKRKGGLDNNVPLPPNNPQAPPLNPPRLTCSVKLKAALCTIFNSPFPGDRDSNFDSTADAIFCGYSNHDWSDSSDSIKCLDPSDSNWYQVIPSDFNWYKSKVMILNKQERHSKWLIKHDWTDILINWAW